MSADLTILRLELLKKSGFYPRTILDIGAQVGDFGVPVHEIWPEAKIFMIEANQDHAIHLREFPWLLGYEIALLGDKNKSRVKYYASTRRLDGGNSIFKEQTGYFDNCEVRLIPMITLDSLIQRRKIKNIDFIKIDVQGSELNIINGGESKY